MGYFTQNIICFITYIFLKMVCTLQRNYVIFNKVGASNVIIYENTHIFYYFYNGLFYTLTLLRY